MKKFVSVLFAGALLSFAPATASAGDELFWECHEYAMEWYTFWLSMNATEEDATEQADVRFWECMGRGGTGN